MRKGSRLRGGDLDKDTLAFGTKGRWETCQDRGINRDANVHGTRRPLLIWRGGAVWVPAGPLRTGGLLRFPKGWEAPSFCLPSLLPPSPPKFHISRNLQGADRGSRVLRAPAPAGWCEQAQSEMGGGGGWGGWRGVGCPPGAEGGWGRPPSPTPAVPRGRSTRPAAPGPAGGRAGGAFTRSSFAS